MLSREISTTEREKERMWEVTAVTTLAMAVRTLGSCGCYEWGSGGKTEAEKERERGKER